MEKHLSLYIFSLLRSKRRYYLLKNIFLYAIHKSQNGKFLWLDKTSVSYYFALCMTLKTKTGCFLLFCFVYDFKNQNRKFLFLGKTSIFCYHALLMVSKTKTTSFHDLVRTLFLVLLLCLWLQKQNGKFLCLDQAFVLCSFAWFMAIKLETGIF